MIRKGVAMSRSKSNMNTIYISERVQECMRSISECEITTVSAPMGYGKTTAINWYLRELSDRGSKILRMSIYSSNINLFWQSFQRAFGETAIGEHLSKMEFPIGDTALGLLLELCVQYLSTDKLDYYLFIDDYHLMNDYRTMNLLLSLARNVPKNVHLIISSRDTFISRKEELLLGNRLHQISVNDLRLNLTELSIYSRRCGVFMDKQQLIAIEKLSEGWFSAIYLNLKAFLDNGILLTESNDIFEMMNETLLFSLRQEERNFLFLMSFADEFTIEQASYITELEGTIDIARKLIKSNAFVRLLPDGKTYRFHHMLKECTKIQFECLPKEKQQYCLTRYGVWHESQKEYIRAIKYYMKAGNNKAILNLIGIDRGIQLASMSPEKILSWLENCAEEELIADPRGLLVLMRRLFSWREIPKMLEMKEILVKATKNKEMTKDERANLLGECDLILSFLHYNDIAAMSKLHQSACKQMTRNAISIESKGSYTFGSPSVLMMFHREAGQMDKELETMIEAMPYYYQLSKNQGMGAEVIMEAEVFYLRGNFTDAKISLEKARQAAQSEKQRYILLCCDFLALRMTLNGQLPYEKEWYQVKKTESILEMDSLLLTVADGCLAYFHALVGVVNQIPSWMLEGRLMEMNLLQPAKPMYEIIHNQVLLAQGKFVELIGRSEGLLKVFNGFSYALCTLHLHIQLAAAYEALGKRKEAQKELLMALEMAIPDGCIIPFVENYQYLEPVFKDMDFLEKEFITRIRGFAEPFEQVRKVILREGMKAPIEKNLTKMEYRICKLIEVRKTNREIAEELYLSEGTIKQYINQIYTKLEIPGESKEKRKQISVLMNQKY